MARVLGMDKEIETTIGFRLYGMDKNMTATMGFRDERLEATTGSWILGMENSKLLSRLECRVCD